MSRSRRFGSFLLVGALGFGVDLATFTAMQALTASPLASRISASLVAIVATWLLNRRFTFGRMSFQRAGPEFLRYLVASLIGASANFLAFALLLHFTGSIALAYLGGTAAGLFVNFTGYSRFVFSEKPE